MVPTETETDAEAKIKAIVYVLVHLWWICNYFQNIAITNAYKQFQDEPKCSIHNDVVI